MREITYKGETHTFQEWCRILQESSNDGTLREFAEELVLNGKITNESLYTLYTIWKGEDCLPKASFQKRIAKTFRRYRPDLEPYRSGKVRGWRFSDGK